MRNIGTAKLLAACSLAIGLATSAHAQYSGATLTSNGQTLTFTGGTNAGGDIGQLSALATFTRTATGGLEITLRHTGPNLVERNGQVLTGLFFDIDQLDAVQLAGSTANLGSGSSWVNGGGKLSNQEPQTYDALNQHWMRKKGPLNAPQGHQSDFGIASVGYNVFGPHDAFLQPGDPGSVDYGSVYGVVTNPSNGLQGPFVDDTLRFNFNANFLGNVNIRNVYFQFGSSLNQPFFQGFTPTGPSNPPVVPEPSEYAAMGMAGMALCGMMVRARRRRTVLSA